jgi:hypothetical protein
VKNEHGLGVDPERPHLGGYVVGGDAATFFPGLWDWLVDTWQVRSVIDVGCGEGHALKFFRDRGCCVIGIDGIEQDDRDVVTHDYATGPWSIYDEDGATTRPDGLTEFDLAWSCEFVEHVEERYVPNFLATFACARYVLMTHGEPGQPGWHHVNCVVEGTPVASPDVHRAFRRRYVGDVVTLVTSGGDELTVTPNHPVATPDGWKAAGELQEGDDLVGGVGADWVRGGVMPHSDETPPLAEQVFRTLAEMHPSRVESVPTSPEEFHGDGMEGKVDVVGTDRFLADSQLASLDEQGVQQRFGGRRVRQVLLTRRGTRNQSLRSVFASPSRVQHLASASRSLLLAHDLPSASVPLGIGGHGVSVLLDDLPDDGWGDREMFRDTGERAVFAPRLQHPSLVDVKSRRLSLGSDVDASGYKVPPGRPVVSASLDGEGRKRFPREVTVKKLVGIHRSEYSGYVYNFSTTAECYWANGLIVHNCQPADYWKGALAAVGYQFDETLTAQARGFASMNTDPYNHFRRSGLAFRRYE